MEFKPYKINENFEYSFYQLPRDLFENPIYSKSLSLESKVLYAFLLNRMNISTQNKWFDDEGSIYLIYKRESVQEELNLSDKTVTKAFKQLAEVGLIYEKRQGKNKPNLIYVGKIANSISSKNRNRKISDSGVVKNTSQDPENLRGNNNNINKNKGVNIYTPKVINMYRDNSNQYTDLERFYAN